MDSTAMQITEAMVTKKPCFDSYRHKDNSQRYLKPICLCPKGSSRPDEMKNSSIVWFSGYSWVFMGVEIGLPHSAKIRRTVKNTSRKDVDGDFLLGIPCCMLSLVDDGRLPFTGDIIDNVPPPDSIPITDGSQQPTDEYMFSRQDVRAVYVALSIIKCNASKMDKKTEDILMNSLAACVGCNRYNLDWLMSIFKCDSKESDPPSACFNKVSEYCMHVKRSLGHVRGIADWLVA